MIFGTYQALVEDKTILDADRYYNPELGFAPIWAVPLNNFKDAIISTMCSAPNYPILFYIIDTNDYVRIDKIKHYQNLKNGIYTGSRENKIDSNDYSSIISDDCDNMHSEFLIDPVKLTYKNIINAFPVFGADNPSVLRRIIKNAFMHCKFGNSNAINEITMIAMKYLKNIPDINMNVTKQDMLAQHVSEFMAERLTLTLKSRLVFESIAMPLICSVYCHGDEENEINFVLDEGVFETVMHNYHKINKLRDNFTLWSRDDCSLETYNNIINSFRNYIIDDSCIRTAIAHNEKINPNDKCPCGSGKKFKKCHGLYV